MTVAPQAEARRTSLSSGARWGIRHCSRSSWVPGARLYLKAEWLNPGGSVKDRAARAILRDGLCRGELPGKRLLDASSGNTGIAYAMLGAAAGVAGHDLPSRQRESRAQARCSRSTVPK